MNWESIVGYVHVTYDITLAKQILQYLNKCCCEEILNNRITISDITMAADIVRDFYDMSDVVENNYYDTDPNH